MKAHIKAYWLKEPVHCLGQRDALTVLIDGVFIPSRSSCSHKAHAGYGARLRADTDRRWSGTGVPDGKETEPKCLSVKHPVFPKRYDPQERRLTGHFYGWHLVSRRFSELHWEKEIDRMI